MPESLDINLDELVEITKEKISEFGGNFSHSEKKPIAFGLSALIISFAFPESNEIDELGNSIEEIKGVSSVELIDYRRAVG